MIDLNLVVERFLDDAVKLYGNGDQQADESVIDAIARKDPNQSRETRESEVFKWLRSYSVFRGLEDADASAVVSEILKFADDSNLGVIPTSKEEIIGLFNDLHERCRSKVHRNKDGTLRDLTSLTSKALWCCYPEAIPLFDSRAGRGLCVLSHLMNSDRPPRKNDSRYEPFLTVWLELYRRVEPTIDENRDRLGRIRHKVRVFDAILWMIGGPDF
ncbi:MAG: hypothetical protein WAK26_07085 [Terracidiphilus sp.]